jgi:VanZ family protein
LYETDASGRIGWVWLTASLVMIAVFTLFPFTFEFHFGGWRAFANGFGLRPSTYLDLPLNILLFAPFGFALTRVLAARGSSSRGVAALVLLVGLTVTFAVESLQTFLTHRTPNISDMVANVFGAVLGWGAYRVWRDDASVLKGAAGKLRAVPSVVVVAGCCGFAALTASALLMGFAPGGWDPSYHLAIANEVSGDRPWLGSVDDVVMLERAVDARAASDLLDGRIPAHLRDAVVMHYSWSDRAAVQDHGGRLPALTPVNGRAREAASATEPPGRHRWLLSEGPVAWLAERIDRSRQFTLALTVESVDATQGGPARILTISQDPFHRNLTLGQEGSELALRWRSNLTGANGLTPELRFPRVFATPGPRRLVISHDGVTVRLVSSQGSANSTFLLGPEVGFGAILRETTYWPVTAGEAILWGPTLVFGSLLLMPLGALVGVTSNAGTWMARAGRVSAVVLVGTIMEGIVAAYSRGQMRVTVSALNVALAAAGLAVARVAAAARRLGP